MLDFSDQSYKNWHFYADSTLTLFLADSPSLLFDRDETNYMGTDASKNTDGDKFVVGDMLLTVPVGAVYLFLGNLYGKNPTHIHFWPE